MPVTAKLSKLFYERLGDQIVNELAEWLNQVDLSYRSELREQNEMNFARFDAKLDQRVAQLDARLSAKIDTGLAHLEAKMERRFGEQTRWLFAGWVTIILAMIGLWARR
jgi:BMFP domain-containing protein YqiC